MAITDVPAFAHLTDADIDNLAVELDAIRLDVDARLGASPTRATSIAPSPRNVRSRSPADCC